MKKLKTILCQILNKMDRSLKTSFILHFILLIIIIISSINIINEDENINKSKDFVESILKENKIIDTFSMPEDKVDEIYNEIEKEKENTLKIEKRKNDFSNNKKKATSLAQRIKEKQKKLKNKIKNDEKIKNAKEKANNKLKNIRKNRLLSQNIKNANIKTSKIREKQKQILNNIKKQKQDALNKQNARLATIKKQNARLAKIKQETFEIEQLNYVMNIKNKIVGNWIQDNGKVGWQCQIKVIQTKNGNISKFNFGHCENNNKFKESIKKAVFDSRPLPLPEKSELFDPVLNFTFLVE